MAEKKRRDPKISKAKIREERKRAFAEKEASSDVTEKIRVDGEIKRRENKYYVSLAERYRIAGFVLFLLFVVFCGVMMIRYSEYITYDNFVYLIRDFDSMDSSKTENVSEIPLDIDASAAVRPFRNGFAVAERDSVTVYDSTGVVLFSESERFSYPALAVSDKYIIAYDIGGDSYSVYNAVTRIVTRKTEFPIVCASVCDDGSFLVTTESDEAKYVTEVYNTALRNTMNIFKDKYVVSSAISADGEWICIASLAENGADFACEVAFYKIGENSAHTTLLYNMAMPLLVTGFDGGNFGLICDDAVRFFSPSGELVAESAVSGNGISCFDTETWGVILVCRENSIGTQNRVYTFDTEGNIIYNSLVNERISSSYLASKNNGAVGYLIYGEDVISLGHDGNDKKSFEEDIAFVIDTGSGSYAYSPGKAVFIDGTESEEN